MGSSRTAEHISNARPHGYGHLLPNSIGFVCPVLSLCRITRGTPSSSAHLFHEISGNFLSFKIFATLDQQVKNNLADGQTKTISLPSLIFEGNKPKNIVELVLFHMTVCTETHLKNSVEVCNELQEISFPQLFQSRNIVKLY